LGNPAVNQRAVRKYQREEIVMALQQVPDILSLVTIGQWFSTGKHHQWRGPKGLGFRQDPIQDGPRQIT
jgi:hypothetical protein